MPANDRRPLMANRESFREIFQLSGPPAVGGEKGIGSLCCEQGRSPSSGDPLEPVTSLSGIRVEANSFGPDDAL